MKLIRNFLLVVGIIVTFFALAVGFIVIVAGVSQAENTIKIQNYNGPLASLMFVNSSPTGFMLGSEGRIYKTNNSGQSWNQIYQFTSYLNKINFKDEQIGFAVGQIGAVIKSTDGGESWTRLPNFTNEHLQSVTFKDNAIYVSGNMGALFKSTNLGASWNNLSVPLSGHFHDVGFQTGEGYAISDANPALWKSSNGGQSWFGTSLPDQIIGLGLYTAEAGPIYVIGMDQSFDPVVLKNTNNDWQTTSLPTGIFLRDIDFSNNGTGFIIGSNDQPKISRVYRTNGTGEWELFEQKIGKELYSLACKDNSVWVTSDSGMVFQYDIIVGIHTNNNSITQDYNLSQNYPNPFNPSTKINFSLPKAGSVKLSVYNISGTEVQVLLNENMSAGEHSVDFNGSNFASGTYFYKIETNDFAQVKKMMLIK